MTFPSSYPNPWLSVLGRYHVVSQQCSNPVYGRDTTEFEVFTRDAKVFLNEISKNGSIELDMNEVGKSDISDGVITVSNVANPPHSILRIATAGDLWNLSTDSDQNISDMRWMQEKHALTQEGEKLIFNKSVDFKTAHLGKIEYGHEDCRYEVTKI